MKFLTDENIATSVVRGLRKKGFDIKDVKEEKLYGSSDKELLQIACKAAAHQYFKDTSACAATLYCK